VAIVVDASALVSALLGKTSSARELRRRLGAETCHAPHLIDAEVGNVLRRRVLRSELSPSDAQTLLAAAGPLVDRRYEMSGALARAAWILRENLSFYDALYVALAHGLTCPLVTADDRLSRAPGLLCTVELVSPV